MRDTILLFESRDLCYESNRCFISCMADAFEAVGYPVEICDLSVRMEQQLEDLLERQEQFLAAFDFNSLLPRMELSDGTPYLEAFHVPFFNYLVDHPFYHHIGICRTFPDYYVICIDTCHSAYVRQYYPAVRGVYDLPLGGVKAGLERTFSQKRIDLLLPASYDPEDGILEMIEECDSRKQAELYYLIERLSAEPELPQEAALSDWLYRQGEELDAGAFAKRMNQDFLADQYLRNHIRRKTAEAAAENGLPLTIVGHGWEHVPGLLEKKNVTRYEGIGYRASVQMIADAKILLNTTPGFHGGLHDRVYTGMLNGCVCLTEKSSCAGQILTDGEDAVLYDPKDLPGMAQQAGRLLLEQTRAERIAQCAKEHAGREHTWKCRIRKLTEQLLDDTILPD